MDFGLSLVLSIVKIADKAGVFNYFKKVTEKSATALYKKLLEDRDFNNKYLKKFFDSEIDKIFDGAFEEIAPKNESLKRKFILAVLTEPDIVQTLDNLEKGNLPKAQILIPVFKKVLPGKNPADISNEFLNVLKDKLSDDQKSSFRVLLNLPEQIDEQHEKTRELIRNLLKVHPISSPEKQAFKIYLAKLPTTGHDLFGREKELEMLHKAWADSHTNIFSLVAFGGVGKSALVNAWLNNMAHDDYRGAERVYGWSFYSQGTSEDRQVSADEFFADALEWFGYKGDPILSPWDKGKKLAELVRAQRTLLILDGLEPLQYPPGEMQGRLKDQGLQALLKGLASSQPGLCIISTRLNVTDLTNFDSALVKVEGLEHLEEKAGAELLKSLGVEGTDKELLATSKEFKGHALALNLLGSYLATVHDGEIRKRDLIPKLTADEEKGGHARRVMESYEIWLKDKPELNILYLMGLFDRPAEGGALQALRAEPAIEGLTDELQNLSQAKWQYAIKHLRDLRLLADKEEARPDILDCHPLVREHFGEQLLKSSKKAWREAHSRLYEYYKNLPVKHLPDTLAEMEPLFAAVAHGCLAGRHQEALDDVFLKRIDRGRAFVAHQLGAMSSALAVVSSFFDEPWSIVSAKISGPSGAFLFNVSGFCLRSLGRLREATAPLQASLAFNIENEGWKNAAVVAGNLGELYLTMGQVHQAVDTARQSYDFSERIGDMSLLAGCNTPLIPPQGEKLKEAEHYLTQAVAGLRQWNNRTNCHTAFSSEQRCTAFRKIGRSLGRSQRSAGNRRSRGDGPASGGFSFGGLPFAFGAAQSRGVVYPRIRRGEIYFALPENHLESAKGHVKTAKEMIDKMGYHRRDPELDELRSLISKIK